MSLSFEKNFKCLYFSETFFLKFTNTGLAYKHHLEKIGDFDGPLLAPLPNILVKKWCLYHFSQIKFLIHFWCSKKLFCLIFVNFFILNQKSEKDTGKMILKIEFMHLNSTDGPQIFTQIIYYTP